MRNRPYPVLKCSTQRGQKDSTSRTSRGARFALLQLLVVGCCSRLAGGAVWCRGAHFSCGLAAARRRESEQ